MISTTVITDRRAFFRAFNLGVNSRFPEVWVVERMAVEGLPIRRDPLRNTGQKMAGQIAHLYPGQDQETALVSEQTDVGLALLCSPTDKAVPGAQMPRGGA